MCVHTVGLFSKKRKMSQQLAALQSEVALQAPQEVAHRDRQEQVVLQVLREAAALLSEVALQVGAQAALQRAVVLRDLSEVALRAEVQAALQSEVALQVEVQAALQRAVAPRDLSEVALQVEAQVALQRAVALQGLSEVAPPVLNVGHQSDSILQIG
jgi:hypothetical protein